MPCGSLVTIDFLLLRNSPSVLLCTPYSVYGTESLDPRNPAVLKSQTYPTLGTTTAQHKRPHPFISLPMSSRAQIAGCCSIIASLSACQSITS